MKTKLFTLFLALAASVGTMFADGTKIGDLYYNLNSGDKTAEVTYELSWNDENNYKGLTTANIPASVTYSGTTYSVTSIGDGAFHNCSSLTSVTIPNSVTNIGIYAFFFCSSLTSVTIPNSVTSIGDEAFQNCSSLTSLSVEAGNTVYDSRNNCNAIIETSTNTLIFGCQNTTIPNSVSSIKQYAFLNCRSLTSVTIPNSVTSIGEGAFSGCSGLTSVTIGNSVTSIGEYAFAFCSSLTSVTIPNSVTSIGDYAFDYCSSLTSIEIPNSVTSIGNGAFLGCSSLTSVTIPNSVTSIGIEAFVRCEWLTSIIVEAGNTVYDSRDNCNAIIETSTNTLIAGCQNTTIPNSVTSIGYGAFGGCSSLTSVTIPNSVTSIGDLAFAVCSSLTSVTIPNSVTSIGENAFYYCSSLTSVYNYATTPQAINSNVFEDVNINTCTLYVPEESIALYKSADVWKDFGSIKAAPELSAIEQIRQNTKTQKTITNGQLLILRDGKTYTIQGVEVK